jgi:DNA-binding beta-propeller fold protein YncE/mono/diheme cytochrome c family protein
MRNVRRAFGVLLLAAGVAGCVGADREPDWRGQGDPPDRDEPEPVDAGPGFAEFPGPPFDGGKPRRLSSLIVAATPPPPLSGGTLAVAKDGSVVVAADPDRDRVYLVRPGTQEVRRVLLGAGSEPGRVVLDGAGRAHVALRGRGSVVAIDLATAELGAETPVCSLPRGVAYDAAHDTVVVACAGGELVTLSAADHTKSASAQLDLDLRDVLVRADGSLSVSRYRSAELLHVSGGQVKAKTEPLHLRQNRFSFPKGDVVLDAGILNAGPTSVTMSPTLAWKTVAGSGGSALMLHQESQDDEVVIAESGGYGGGCETITQAGLTYYDEQGKAVNTITLSPHGLVVDVAVSPDGRYAAVAEPGGYLGSGTTVEILVIEGLQDPSAFLESQPSQGSVDAGVPGGPGIALDAGVRGPSPGVGSFIPPSCASGASAGDDSQVTSVAFDGYGVLYAFSREPARLIVYAAQDPSTDPTFGPVWPSLFEQKRFELANTSVRDTGHELFHANVGSGLSCAGCHGEALDDGHVWNFRDFGPRRTQTMRGGLLSTLPLHWEGDLPTFNHLVAEVMTRRMGGFKVEEKYGDALGTWLDKLPPMKLESKDAGAVQRGKLLFESPEVACATCHSGAHFTNNASFDVGTGETLQVPTLLGIALHPPFMHDGCAVTLEERFDPSCGGGDRHGHTSHLTTAELADLVSYLKSL